MVAEGYATGTSLHEATGLPVAVAFDAGNLAPVGEALREKYPNAALVFAADNDHKTRIAEELRNIGVERAEAAAKAVGGAVIVPTLSEAEKAAGLTDFNDVAKARGIKGLEAEVAPRLEALLDKSKQRARAPARTGGREAADMAM